MDLPFPQPQASSYPLSARALEGVGALAALEPRWRALADAAGADSPFFLPDWAGAWWKHLARDQPLVSDHPVTFIVERGDQLVAVAPMMITRRPGTGPLRLRCLQFIGTDPNVTELRRMLCCPADEVAAQQAVLACATERGGWDWALWSGVTSEAAWRALSARRGAVVGPETTAFKLALPFSWEVLRAGLSRNMKESLRKSVNAPKRAGVELAFAAEQDPERLPALLETFFSLHSRRSACTGTVVHGDVFAAPQSRAFLRDVCGRLAARDGVCLFTLRHDGEVVAMRLGFLVGRTVYLYFSGYDPAYRKYSVMTRCVAETIRWAIEGGYQAVHLSPGRDLSKTRWGPREQTTRAVTLVGDSVRSRASHALYCLATAGRREGVVQAGGVAEPPPRFVASATR